jgi:hypothetical protein
MKLRHGYLGLCILGAVLPYSQFIPWFRAHGLDLPLFFTELFSTRIGGFLVCPYFCTCGSSRSIRAQPARIHRHSCLGEGRAPVARIDTR